MGRVAFWGMRRQTLLGSKSYLGTAEGFAPHVTALMLWNGGHAAVLLEGLPKADVRLG